jgi:hypothetical protein
MIFLQLHLQLYIAVVQAGFLVNTLQLVCLCNITCSFLTFIIFTGSSNTSETTLYYFSGVTLFLLLSMSICKNLATSSYEGFIPSLTSVITFLKHFQLSYTVFYIFCNKTRISLEIGTVFPWQFAAVLLILSQTLEVYITYHSTFKSSS